MSEVIFYENLQPGSCTLKRVELSGKPVLQQDWIQYNTGNPGWRDYPEKTTFFYEDVEKWWENPL